MHEHEVSVAGDVQIAAALCLPEDAGPDRPVPAIALIAGSGADTRDGDLDLPAAVTQGSPAPGTVRRIAHHLAQDGVASLRWDRRGFGSTGGDRAAAGYHTDLDDAIACFRWLQARPEIDERRVAVAGHSAGALVACRVCRDVPDVAAAGLLGALASPIVDLLSDNLGRVRAYWDRFTPDQRDWLSRNSPALLARADGIERLLEGARRGDEVVRLEAQGVVVDMPTIRLRQDLATDYLAEFRHVTCPALVLHGGSDLNVKVEDALRSYAVLREAGNDRAQLSILPGLEHYFIRAAAGPDQRIWERVSQQVLARPMAPEALDTFTAWATAALGGGA